MVSELHKARIAAGLRRAHARLRAERGGFLTPEGKTAMLAKCSAHHTPAWRLRHAERQKPALAAAHRACESAADRFARRFLPLFLDLQKKGLGLRDIAAEMNDRGYSTRQGKCWTDQAVRQVLKRRENIIKPEVINRRRYIGWDRRI